MHKYILKLLVLVLAILLPMQLASSTHASNAPVKLAIPDTRLTIKGFSSPGAFVQIFDGDALIGTVLADSNGVFEKDFTSMSAGLHNIRLQYEDADGIRSDPLAQTINVRAQSDTALEYFLPPTLLAAPVNLVEGEFANFTGTTIPNATVEIILDGGNLILRPQSGPDGRFSISVDTTGYYFGEHNIVATATQGGLTSFQTLKKPFIIIPVESSAGNRLDPRLLDPPIISNGQNGEIIATEDSALIRGTASPSSQVIVYLDGEPIGSTFANADGGWFFNVPLSKSVHEVRTISCFDNECSDFSNLIKITFGGEFGECSLFRFWLDDYRFWGVNLNDGINLNVTGTSGQPAYEVLIDWGDTTTERFNRNSAQSYNIHHVYDTTGQYNGRITVVDENECEFTRYFSSEVTENQWNLWFVPYLGGGIALVLLLILRRKYRVRRKKISLSR